MGGEMVETESRVDENVALGVPLGILRAAGARRELGEILKEGSSATGLAEAQTEDFCDRADAWAGRFPEAKDYAPEPIL